MKIEKTNQGNSYIEIDLPEKPAEPQDILLIKVGDELRITADCGYEQIETRIPLKLIRALLDA